jgi:hypothetical protein
VFHQTPTQNVVHRPFSTSTSILDEVIGMQKRPNVPTRYSYLGVGYLANIARMVEQPDYQ